MVIYCICPQYLVGATFALITASIFFNSAWHGGDQFVALLRRYGSPGFFDSGLQLICMFGLLFLSFLLTIPYRFSMGFRSGEFAGQSSKTPLKTTRKPNSLTRLCVVALNALTPASVYSL